MTSSNTEASHANTEASHANTEASHANTEASHANAEALRAMLAHHQALGEGFGTRVAALAEAVAAGGPMAAATAELVAYLAGEILPHARAEEDTIYRAAAALPGLSGTVTEMIAEHETLAAAAGGLAAAPDGSAALSQAEASAALFTTHVAKENDVLLPALLASGTVDLAGLLAQMHDRMRAAQPAAEQAAAETAGTDAAESPDSTAALLRLLLDATTALARAGEGDRACRIAAAAWATLREARPSLAVRVTAALHGLARQAASRPDPAAADLTLLARTESGLPAETSLDVRQLAPAQRHESIFAAYQALAPGAAFVLVNDHDPKPLRYQFEAEHSGEFSWQYLEEGPEVWRVRIGRPDFAGGRPAAAAAAEPAREPDGEPELDVRTIPHFQRHDVIFRQYRALGPGAGFVIVNDHDPRPLRYQFEAQYAGSYTWDYQAAGPEIWRVRIGRPAGR